MQPGNKTKGILYSEDEYYDLIDKRLGLEPAIREGFIESDGINYDMYVQNAVNGGFVFVLDYNGINFYFEPK